MFGCCIRSALPNAPLSYLLPALLMMLAWLVFSSPENFSSKWACASLLMLVSSLTFLRSSNAFERLVIYSCMLSPGDLHTALS